MIIKYNASGVIYDHNDVYSTVEIYELTYGVIMLLEVWFMIISIEQCSSKLQAGFLNLFTIILILWLSHYDGTYNIKG